MGASKEKRISGILKAVEDPERDVDGKGSKL